ncbi:hypothetical protein [Methanoregula sp.]
MLKGTTLVFIRKDDNDGRVTILTTMDPNGTFPIGMVIYKKTS